jgi:hypothetical protein
LDDAQGRGRRFALRDASEIEILGWIQNKQKNLVQSHGSTFSIAAKRNHLVLFPDGESILRFCDTEKS